VFSYYWIGFCFSLPILATADNMARTLSASITKFVKGNVKPRFTYANERKNTFDRGGKESGKRAGIAHFQWGACCHTLPA
jgi:hypothetical protein